ncbi:MAG: DUF5011 domain-containing protein [bacterium]|nr:DUF5011 domain-containing protein [bacterium]
MEKKILKYVKIAITIAIPCLFAWFLIIYPFLEFKKNENILEEAAKRYYELNSSQLPTGKRIASISSKELYNKSYIKEDFYIPYTNKTCSVTNSWVKVRKDDSGNYQYYTYLECGVFKSKVDAKGPVITLNGENEITINLGEEYKELGVKSVKDDKDGKMDVKDVTIDSSKVDTTQTGTYEVTYTAFDSLKNKTKVTRKVNVVQKINKTVEEATDETNLYKGLVANNYISFSGMLFRIIGLDGNNVKIITDNDIASVNYDAIDKWLDYFYEHISDDSKKLVVKNKYCTNKIDTSDINSNTTCSEKTKKRDVYILSNKEINESRDAEGDSYLFTETINWIANASSDTHAWSTKYNFIPYESSTQFYAFSKEYNFSIRPVLTINGDSLIKSGNGTKDNPYSLGDIKTGKANDYLSTRYSGEYVTYSGKLWKIMETTVDGYTKVIAESPIELIDSSKVMYSTEDEIKIYNPTQKGNIGYIINKKTSDSVDEEYFVTKEISVPIYKTVAKYGEEIETKKYKVKFSAPNMYEMFTAEQSSSGMGYWLINSSQEEFRKYVISNIGVVIYDLLPDHFETCIRPVGYLDKNIKIVSGSGTKVDPYKISK